jgi:hypothetical protein
MGLANYLLKRYREAVRLCAEQASRWPNLQLAHLPLAGAYAQSGHLEEARAEAAEVLRINPGFTKDTNVLSSTRWPDIKTGSHRVLES